MPIWGTQRVHGQNEETGNNSPFCYSAALDSSVAERIRAGVPRELARETYLIIRNSFWTFKNAGNIGGDPHNFFATRAHELRTEVAIRSLSKIVENGGGANRPSEVKLYMDENGVNQDLMIKLNSIPCESPFGL
jgi:hypothetical protein